MPVYSIYGLKRLNTIHDYTYYSMKLCMGCHFRVSSCPERWQENHPLARYDTKKIEGRRAVDTGESRRQQDDPIQRRIRRIADHRCDPEEAVQSGPSPSSTPRRRERYRKRRGTSSDQGSEEEGL